MSERELSDGIAALGSGHVLIGFVPRDQRHPIGVDSVHEHAGRGGSPHRPDRPQQPLALLAMRTLDASPPPQTVEVHLANEPSKYAERG